MAILTLSVTFVARQLEVLVCLMSGANVKKISCKKNGKV